MKYQMAVERSVARKTEKHLKNEGAKLMDYIRETTSCPEISVGEVAEYLRGSQELTLLLHGAPVEQVAKRYLQSFFGGCA